MRLIGFTQNRVPYERHIEEKLSDSAPFGIQLNRLRTFSTGKSRPATKLCGEFGKLEETRKTEFAGNVNTTMEKHDIRKARGKNVVEKEV